MEILKKYLVLTTLLILSLTTKAQDVTVTGIVTGEDGEPLRGASINVDGIGELGRTTAIGFFSVKVQANQSYVFRFNYLQT